jgi:2-keto-4-pentenoate hydratase
MKLNQVDLLNCKMQLMKNGKLASEGVGSACLASPINAAIWLARKMAVLGSPLQEGDIILSGALGPMVLIEPGDTYKAKIEGLGDVSVSVSNI